MSGPADPSIDEAFIEVHEQLRSLADLLMRSERADSIAAIDAADSRDRTIHSNLTRSPAR
ncbi:MAG: hypothetical protein ACO3Y3_12795 [Phycisphaerales bacterium]